MQDFIAQFKTMSNEDRAAANAAERAETIKHCNAQSLKQLRQAAQRRLDVALARCCQEWFSAPAKKKKGCNSETLLGMCSKWWREVEEILIWRAQPAGVRVEVGGALVLRHTILACLWLTCQSHR